MPVGASNRKFAILKKHPDGRQMFDEILATEQEAEDRKRGQAGMWRGLALHDGEDGEALTYDVLSTEALSKPGTSRAGRPFFAMPRRPSSISSRSMESIAPTSSF